MLFHTEEQVAVDIVVFAIIALVLLAILVFGLHRYQLSETQYNADKTSPLPPLAGQELNSFKSGPDQGSDSTIDRDRNPQAVSLHEVPEEVLATPVDKHTSEQAVAQIPRPTDPFEKAVQQAEETPQEPAGETTTDDAPATAPCAEPAATSSNSTPASAPVADTSSRNQPALVTAHLSTEYAQPAAASEPSAAQSSAKSHSAPEGWQDRVAELKKSERLDEALAVCRQAFPLLSAYQQATLIHRARIKQLTDAMEIENELAALYRLAAQASFLHDKVKGMPHLSLAQLKATDITSVDELDMAYDRIGYTELRLIKKTDIKLLLEHWGKPAGHNQPRAIHANAWQQLAAQQQSTLF